MSFLLRLHDRFLSDLIARHGRLRVYVLLFWTVISIVLLLAIIAVSKLYITPQMMRIAGVHAEDANSVSTTFLLLMLGILSAMALLIYRLLNQGLIEPLEKFRSSMKTQIGEQQIQFRNETQNTNFEIRKRVDQLQAALDENDQLRAKLEKAVETSQTQTAAAQNIVQSVSDPVAFVDSAGFVSEASLALCELLQRHRSAIIGAHFEEVFDIYDAYRDTPLSYPIRHLIQDALAQASSVPKIVQVLLLTPHRNELRLGLRLSCAIGPSGEALGVVIRLLPGEKETQSLSSSPGAITGIPPQDMVTGLASAELFDLRLHEIIDIARAQKVSHSLLLLSPDHLATVSEAYGLRAGDEVLWRTARLAREQAGKNVEVYKVGLDLIGMIAPFSALQQQADLVNRLILASSGQPFVWGDNQHESSLSIGGIEINQQSEGAESLLKQVHRALIAARHRGGGVAELYFGDEALESRRRQDDDWIAWLIPRLENGYAHLSSQAIMPIGSSPDLKPLFEVFVRIEDDDGVWITPDYYMPALERRQRSHVLDLWVTRTVITEMARNPALTRDYACACINVSGWSIIEPGFAESIRQLLQQYKVSGSHLCFELSEPQVISHLSETLRFMECLRPLGVRFALDRYRAMGGLHSLREAPLDYVKIHASMTQALSDDHDDAVERLHMTWMNKICQARGITSIALNVEQEHTLRILRSLDIPYAQGVLLNKIGPLVM